MLPLASYLDEGGIILATPTMDCGSPAVLLEEFATFIVGIGECQEQVHRLQHGCLAGSVRAKNHRERWQREYIRRLVRWRDDLIILPDLTAIFAAVLSPRA